MSDYKYHVTYKLEARPEGLTKEEVPEGFGACDAGVFLSCLYPPDGSFSMLLCSLDGRTKAAMSDDEIFKVWSLLAHRLAKSTTLSENKRSFAEAVFDTFALAMKTTHSPT